VYISRLVKTRDLYPGLLQFAISSHFLSVCLLFYASFSIFFLSSISIFNPMLVFILWKCYQAFSRTGDLLSSHIVSANQVTCCTATIPVVTCRQHVLLDLSRFWTMATLSVLCLAIEPIGAQTMCKLLGMWDNVRRFCGCESTEEYPVQTR
jgi:hypothetical protein